MSLERHLRKLSVGQRMAAIIALLLLPMAALSIASVAVLNDQEIAFRDSVEESIQTLLPLTTLEHYLQRALVDELEAQSNESVPNFAALTENIDRTFESIESKAPDPDLQETIVIDAQQAWRNARPSVQRLIEQVRSLHPDTNGAVEGRTRQELQQAIQDISLARQHLARAVEARYTRAVAARHAQLRWLVWSWVVTLSIATVLIVLFLRSLLNPIKALGRAAHSLGDGVAGVRTPVIGNDELAALAERFNDMAAYWDTSRQTLQTEASADPLTGVLNRRGILAALETALLAHARHHQPISIFMLDLDRFKYINDHFGHGAGDRALAWVTAKVREALRESDQLGRYGGDEFLVVLPDTTREHALSIAERMTDAIRDAATREAAYPTVSIGVASTPDDGRDAGSLIQAADTALYASKKRRRNNDGPARDRPGRVVHHLDHGS